MEEALIIVQNVKMKNKIIALSGLICSGKSTMLKMMQDKNFKTISIDALLKKMYLTNGVAFKFVKNYYPQFIINNKFCPDLVKKWALTNNSAFKKYENKIHSFLWKELQTITKSFDETVFVEIPFFPSKKWNDLFDLIICLKVTKKKRLLWLQNRHKISSLKANQLDSLFTKPNFFNPLKTLYISNNSSIDNLWKNTFKIIEKNI